MTTLKKIAEKIVELKVEDPRMTSDAFQLACQEYLKEKEGNSPKTDLHFDEPYSLFDEETKKYIETMYIRNSWQKVKDFLFLKKKS
jgi:hypothetical protein